MFDYWVSSRLEFTTEDKRACLETAKTIVDLSHKVRKGGILALEEEIGAMPDMLLKAATQLIVDGVREDQLVGALQNWIVSGNYRGRRLFKRLLILEGMTALHQGVSPPFISEYLLASYFGENLWTEYMDYMKYKAGYAYREPVALDQFCEKMKERQNFELDGMKIFESIDNFAMQMIIRNIDRSDMTAVFFGSPETVIRKFLKNMSKKSADALMDRTLDMGNFRTADIQGAQERILNKLSELEDIGMIVIERGGK